MKSKRVYIMEKVSNGWVLSNGYESWVCDTLGEALDQLDAEEKKFLNDE